MNQSEIVAKTKRCMLSEVKYVTVAKPGSCQAKVTLSPLPGAGKFVTRARRCQEQKINGAQRGNVPGAKHGCNRFQARENM